MKPPLKGYPSSLLLKGQPSSPCRRVTLEELVNLEGHPSSPLKGGFKGALKGEGERGEGGLTGASQSHVYRGSQLDERSLSLSLKTETQRADWRQKKIIKKRNEQRRERGREGRRGERERVRRKRTKEERKKKERRKGERE